MAAYLETPSRVWRRIQADQDRDMPSLPSLPGFEESGAPQESIEEEDSEQDMHIASPIQSTPIFLSRAASTVRAPSSTSSTARFARSMASRSSKSSLTGSRGSVSRRPAEDSFDVSSIPSLPVRHDDSAEMDIRSSDQDTESSVPEVYLPPTMDENSDLEFDLSEALQSVSRANSPSPEPEPQDHNTPRKKSDYDLSVSLRSEPKPSPFDKLRNGSFRRPLSRTRTPSLTRTLSSPSSSVSNSTPHSSRSARYQRQDSDPPLAALTVPLPRSATASPAFPSRVEERYISQMRLSPELPSPDLEGPADDTELLPEVAAEIERERESLRESQSSGRQEDSSSRQEPTFSSEGASENGGSAKKGSRGIRSPTPLSVAFSSPGSALFTPTPAFQPRPRSRFGTPDSEEDFDQDYTAHPDVNDPTTPHAHKRSFLLSVINSTARPRMRFPTPHHPRNDVDESQFQVEMTPGPGVTMTPAMTPGPVPSMTPGLALNLRGAFAGATPRARPMRRRLSQPLPQALSDSASEHDAAAGASFVSTASSHDLTTHARANASFDPVMGLGDRGHGVGRFNAGKLNSYLHGLNRRLQEENEMLVSKLRVYESGSGSGSSATGTSDGSRRASGGRRVSAGPALGLGAVAEHVAEGLLEEKAALEEMVEELHQELEACTAEKTKAEETLEAERTDRARDKERWRERMNEVEKGVEEIVAGLEQRVAEAEEAARRAEEERDEGIRDVERRMAVVQVEKEVIVGRLKSAEAALENGRDLGAEVNTANQRVAQAQAELQNARRQIEELETHIMRSEERLDDVEGNLSAERKRTAALEEELRSKMDELSEQVQCVEQLEEEVRNTRTQLRQAEDALVQNENDAAEDVARFEDLKKEADVVRQGVEQLEAELEEERVENDRLADEADKGAELARQMEDALEAAEKKMLEDEQEVASLKAKITSLERAVEKAQERSMIQAGPSQSAIARDQEAEIAALEAEVDDANKEIARLRTMIAQSPARRAIERTKDARIELLEKEREDLLERLRATRNQSAVFNSPVRVASGSGMSPLHRQLLNMSLKSPKTPGGPLKDLSWLHKSMNDPTVAPLVSELARLHQELDRANASIDEKLDRLEDAGLGVVELTQQLQDAHSRIMDLEDDQGRLSRREERRIRRLQRLKCPKCRTKVDTKGLDSTGNADESSVLEASTMSFAAEPTRSSETLRSELKEVNTHLDTMKRSWEEERKRLLGEKAVLQDAATRLNAEIRDAKSELRKHATAERASDRARASAQDELDHAKKVMEELEAELKDERSRLRALTSEQTKAQREKDKVERELRRAETDMSDIREQLQRIKQENHDLEHELRSNSSAEQKARILQARVAENAANLDQLRQERSLIISDHKDLQRQYAKATDEVTRLRTEFAATQSAHDARRGELDARASELDDLRRALSAQAGELERAEAERARLTQEKGDVARTVAALEADLQRVRRDAEAFGRDLRALRAQKDRLEDERHEERQRAERAQKQAAAQIRVLTEELDGQKALGKEVARERKAWAAHVCAGPTAAAATADDEQLMQLKLKHKLECKGLVVQIKYLKAKFSRESTFRSELGFQKRWLLTLMGQSERNEERILAAVAQIGYPTPRTSPRRRTLRSVAYMVLFVQRTRYAGRSLV
ncbi:uncharacterized protein BXZ73DRAFT_42510 [Epithele typhae]|uniref:uncharacterized protein n=1 Tax=Epithele typhae TaxID=378194 RepID=UPI002007BD3E|nr:uncharacterized protein BXZ73DRAFT_42510 [Epithele typhae]KAH9940729.1 hypothetical protein BXZ73DRAFT_42510 [Epithele typhae]